MTPEEQLEAARRLAAARGEAIAVLTEKWAERRAWHQRRYQQLRLKYRTQEAEVTRLRALITALPAMPSRVIMHMGRDYQLAPYFTCETLHHAMALRELLTEAFQLKKGGTNAHTT